MEQAHPFRAAFLGLPPDQEGELDELLRQAALQYLRKKAGFIPFSLPELSARSVSEPQALPSEKANRLLRRFLDKADHQRTLDWLKEAAKHGLQPPPELLPQLFRQGIRAEFVGDELFKLLDPTGHWLAAQHPDWHVYLPFGHPQNEQPAFRARLKYWLALRHDDPAAARKEIGKALPKLRSTQARATFDVLGFSLSESDIPFLAQYLDAFPSGVSDLAQQYLYRLKANPWYERLHTLLTTTFGLEKPVPQLDLTPEQLKPTLGFAPDTPQKAGVRQLATLFGAEEWAALDKAEKLENLLLDPVFGQAVGLGLLKAASEASPEQQMHLLRLWYKLPAFRGLHLARPARLAEQLPEKELEVLLTQVPKNTADADFFHDLLHPENAQHPLSGQLSQEIFHFFTTKILVQHAAPESEQWGAALQVYFQRVPLQETEKWALDFQRISPFWQSYWTTYEKVLRLRRRIEQSFK